MVTGIPSHTLQAVISQEVQAALRSGMPIENIIATLIHMGEQLQQMLPVVKAAVEARYAP